MTWAPWIAFVIVAGINGYFLVMFVAGWIEAARRPPRH